MRSTVRVMMIGAMALSLWGLVSPAHAASRAPRLTTPSTWTMFRAPFSVQGTGVPGQRVRLYKHYRTTGWKWESSGRVTRSGRFRLSDRGVIKTMRTRWYKVCSASGCSRPITVTPYAWRSLWSFTSVNTANLNQIGTEINGTYYSQAIWEGSDEPVFSGTTTYLLGRKRRAFTGVHGLGTNSSPGSVGQIDILGDGRFLGGQEWGFEDSGRRTFNVVGVDRLRIETTDLTRDPTTWPSIGSPIVLCRA